MLLLNSSLLEQYDQTFKMQLENEIIEKVEGDNPQGVVSYLPHQAMLTPLRSTTKLRVVFDASTKTSHGKSLNDELFKGRPFCRNWSAPTRSRYCTRLLWLKNREEPVKSNNIQTYRFTRVPFGLTSSPFLLVAKLRKQLKQENTETAKEILNNLYVDNVMLRAMSVKEAAQKYSETKVLFQSTKMIIREFVNNCQE
ncbi:unnamed protein product, partial [Gongylonema pulchrum]|uniref:Reverse transcriptase domain-containing protein n=1 Tax=Gongylonema pulchrum TaxID=637853 RepID=A0A183DIF2_9BILA